MRELWYKETLFWRARVGFSWSEQPHLEEESSGSRGDGCADEQEGEVDVDALGALLLL